MKDAINIIKTFEGLKLKAYEPPEGGAKGWAIGYGYTRPWVAAGCIITEAWAEALLMEEIEIVISKLKGVIPIGSLSALSSNQLQAVVSFIYNVGLGNFKSSTMCKKIIAKDFVGASEEFSNWVFAKGQRLPGLVRRREAERALFVKPAGTK